MVLGALRLRGVVGAVGRGGSGVGSGGGSCIGGGYERRVEDLRLLSHCHSRMVIRRLWRSRVLGSVGGDMWDREVRLDNDVENRGIVKG